MTIIKLKPYEYILVSENDTLYLTFFTGGVVELDVCVRLSADEAEAAKENDENIKALITSFRKNRDLYQGRLVTPSKIK